MFNSWSEAEQEKLKEKKTMIFLILCLVPSSICASTLTYTNDGITTVNYSDSVDSMLAENANYSQLVDEDHTMIATDNTPTTLDTTTERQSTTMDELHTTITTGAPQSNRVRERTIKKRGPCNGQK